jgi:hypothetical protein
MPRLLSFYFRFVMTNSRIIHKEIDYIVMKKSSSNRPSKDINILEIGPGQSKHYEKSFANQGVKVNLTLMDPFPKAILKKIVGINKLVIKKGIAPTGLKLFKTNEFDLVICSHVIEHLEKSQGYLLLYEIDRIAEYSSIISTPNGFAWQPPGEDNPFNAHLSSWTPKELKNLNWNLIYGTVGLKYFFGPGAKPLPIRRTFSRVLGVLYLVFQRFPNFCWAFIAVKRVKNHRTLFMDS